MAVQDWRRYYAPVLVHKISGECRIWRGKLFNSNLMARAKAYEINTADHVNWRCIGIAGLRGKNAAVQQEIWANTRKNGQ